MTQAYFINAYTIKIQAFEYCNNITCKYNADCCTGWNCSLNVHDSYVVSLSVGWNNVS